jgi:glycosyltransferase involved in cell wall biosynthesis
MIDLRNRRIGYVPYSTDLSEPGDRRRFVHFARSRGVPFELARPDERYDVVVLSSRADIGEWSRRPDDGTKLVYELIDSYLTDPRFRPRAILRGVAKFAARETHSLHLDYRKAIEAMGRRADAMICSTEEQRQDYLRLCPNVHLILDVQTDVSREVKQEFGVGATVNIVWEGYPYTLDGFDVIKPVLRELSKDRPLALHLITALEYNEYAGRFRHRQTASRLHGFPPATFLYQWNMELLARIATGCDLAVIPLDLADPFARGKPENKLLGLWRLGVPVVASATPAYRRAMDGAGLALACETPDDWLVALRRLLSSEDERRHASQAGRAYAEREHGEEQVLRRWDALFESVLA